MNELSNKIKYVLFFIICFSIIFNNIPQIFQMNFIGGAIGNKLIFYPVFLGLGYTLYECLRKEWIPNAETVYFINLFKWWGIIYIVVNLLSLIIGLINYPYYDIVFNGPIDQIEKLPKLIFFAESINMDIDTKILMAVWIVVRQIKSMILELIWCFGGAFIIFFWFQKRPYIGVNILRKGVFYSSVIIVLYSSIETFYLGGNETARKVLEIVTPYIHVINSSHGWWPPLLWENQLRMVFSEPSHVGNYIALLFPILFCHFLYTGNKLICVMLVLMSFFVFMTNARTAYAMLLGIIFLIGILLLWINENKKRVLGKFCIIICCICLGFSSYMFFINFSKNNANVSNSSSITATHVLNDNLTSLGEPGKRSNGARYALLKSNLRVFMEFPLLGVGKGMAAQYIATHFTSEELQNGEVATWVKYQDEKGPFSIGYSIQDAMNEYVTRLAQTGIIGLAVFLIPFIFLIKKLFYLYRNTSGKEQFAILMILSTLISTMVAGCNGSINLFYSIWIVLGLGYAFCFSKRDYLL